MSVSPGSSTAWIGSARPFWIVPLTRASSRRAPVCDVVGRCWSVGPAVLVAQAHLRDLAIVLARQLRDEVDRPRALEVRQVPAAERDELPGHGVVVEGIERFVQLDHRLDLLPPLVVGDAD